MHAMCSAPTARRCSSQDSSPPITRTTTRTRPTSRARTSSACRALEEGERVALEALRPEQHFTQPPPRYTEASLVKSLESHGIGRPSTYASIIETLRYRKYVEMLGRAFQPTDIGKIVSKFLVKYFETYVDYGFTAAMEDVLDEISNGEKAWRPELERFWKPFSKLVEHIGKTVSREEVAESREIGRHPESGKPITVRMGAYGPFVQHGTRDDADKPKFASLMPGQHMDDVTLPDALKLLSLPRALGHAPDGTPISVGRGQYGPYVKYGSKFASIKEDDPFEMTLRARSRSSPPSSRPTASARSSISRMPASRC